MGKDEAWLLLRELLEKYKNCGRASLNGQHAEALATVIPERPRNETVNIPELPTSVVPRPAKGKSIRAAYTTMIEDSEFSGWTRNSLLRCGAKTVADTYEIPLLTMCRQRGMGVRQINGVFQMLESYGMPRYISPEELEEASRYIQNTSLLSGYVKEVGKAGNPGPDIFELELSVRATKLLIGAGIRYIPQLKKTTYNELKNIKNMGRMTLTEIIETAKEFGISIT